jgi:HNH endonuclease
MDYVKFNLGNGLFSFVNESDLVRLVEHRWISMKGRRTRYAVANFRNSDGTYSLLKMHTFIMQSELTEQRPLVDHINGNGLDNRRSNLRPCSHQENSFNYTSSRKYKGVVQLPYGKYNARIKHNKKQRSLGCFVTPEEAARRYDQEAKLLFGDFAKLNFPEGIV